MNQEENFDTKQTPSIKKRKILEAIKIGIWGTVIWSIAGYICFWLNLTKISPLNLSKPFLKPDYLSHWQGVLISLLLMMGLSIVFSILYVLFFSHIFTPWIGIVIGVLIWYGMLGWRKIDINSLATTLSIFVLYGAFIGYSLSMEFSSLEKSK